MADRVAVLSQGRLEQFASPTDVYDAPTSLFVNSFVGTANILPGTLVEADRTGGQVRLDSGAVIGTRAPVEAIASGARVVVCVRPEHLRLAADGDEGIAGVVDMGLPLGPTVVHEVRVADGTAIKVSEARTERPAPLPAGTPVRLAPAGSQLATVFPAAAE